MSSNIELFVPVLDVLLSEDGTMMYETEILNVSVITVDKLWLNNDLVKLHVPFRCHV